MQNFLSAEWVRAAAAARTMAIALTALIGLAVAQVATAGDLARPDLIGFSPDGRYVAYEDYGTHDEGLPYSNIYLIDVAANDRVPGSPVRVELAYEDLPDWSGVDDSVSQVRARALAQAQPVLDQYGIVAGATGTTLVHYPLSDLTAPADAVRFSIDAGFTSYAGDILTLHLSQQTLPEHACDQYMLGPVSIMALELEGLRGRGPVALQTDESLPESRACVTGYRIHSVIVYAPNQPDQSACCHRGDLALLVLLETEQFGPDSLEGIDYRHIAVTAMLQDAW